MALIFQNKSLKVLTYVDAFPSLERPGLSSEVGGTGNQYILVSVPVQGLRRDVIIVAGDENERINAAFVAAKYPDALPCIEIPAARRAVIRGTKDEIPSADDAIDQRVMPAEYMHTIARAHVPLAHGLVGTSGEHEVVLNKHSVDVIIVTFQDAYAFAAVTFGGPQPGVAVF